MNFCLLGILSGDTTGILGSFLMAIGHGIVSTALFFLVGILYERTHTRLIDYFSGLGQIAPVISFFMFMFIISNFGFPISLNFVAELLILIGIGTFNILILLFLVFYSVFSVAYNLWLYVRVFHGTLRSAVFNSFLRNDLTTVELKVLFPLGVYNFLLFFVSQYIIEKYNHFCFIDTVFCLKKNRQRAFVS